MERSAISRDVFGIAGTASLKNILKEHYHHLKNRPACHRGFRLVCLRGFGFCWGLLSFFCLKCSIKHTTTETGFVLFKKSNINGNLHLHNRTVINSSQLTPLILNYSHNFSLISSPFPRNFSNQNPNYHFPTFFSFVKGVKKRQVLEFYHTQSFWNAYTFEIFPALLRQYET